MNKFEDLIETGKIKYLHVYEIPLESKKYIIEEIEVNDSIEFWLCNKGYGIKMLVLGFNKCDMKMSIEETENIVLEEANKYIEDYREEYED